MFCSRQANNMMNKLHERALSLFRYIQMLMIELYKTKNELSQLIMDSVLNRNNITYNSKNCKNFSNKERELL